MRVRARIESPSFGAHLRHRRGVAVSPTTARPVDCKPPRTHCRQTATVPITISRPRGYVPASVREQEDGEGRLRSRVLQTSGNQDACSRAEGSAATAPNQDFVPVSDQLLIEHLQGRHVMGVYPTPRRGDLLVSRSSNFRQGWVERRRDGVRRNLPIYRRFRFRSSRSRSGNGGHVWIFFAAPVSANVARRMGCYLITETMSRPA